jgi:hypothetical protein
VPATLNIEVGPDGRLIHDVQIRANFSRGDDGNYTYRMGERIPATITFNQDQKFESQKFAPYNTKPTAPNVLPAN